jgi:hypothetical protein
MAYSQDTQPPRNCQPTQNLRTCTGRLLRPVDDAELPSRLERLTAVAGESRKLKGAVGIPAVDFSASRYSSLKV